MITQSHQHLPPVRSTLHVLLLMVCICGCATQAIADEAMTPAAFVRQYCLDCHSGPDAENGFDMERLSRDLQQTSAISQWVRLYDRIERQEMPPADYDQPTPAERKAFLNAVGGWLHAGSTKQTSTVLRRLNRVEYETH